MIVHAPIHNWLRLVFAIKKHRRREPDIVLTGELFPDLVFALLSKDVHEGKFNISFPQAFVELSSIPVRSEFLTGRAGGIDVANDPGVVVISYHGVLERICVQAHRPCPNTIVYTIVATTKWRFSELDESIATGAMFVD